MKPTIYASGKRWTLWHGDCAEVAPTIEGIDAVIGDPPYGMDWPADSTRFTAGSADSLKSRGRGGVVSRKIHGDTEPFNPAPWLGYPRVVLWGSNHYAQRLPVGTTLLWMKRLPHAYGTFLSDAEVAWMKGGHGVYAKFSSHQQPNRCHPSQKPVEIMEWCIEKAKVPAGGLIFDGWAGSASAGDAALRRGFRYVGCEIDEYYLEGAATRLAQAEDDGVPVPLFGRP